VNYFFYLHKTLSLFSPTSSPSSRLKNKELKKGNGKIAKDVFIACLLQWSARVMNEKKRKKKNVKEKKIKGEENFFPFLLLLPFKNLPKVKFFLARFQCLFIFIWRFSQWDMREWKRNNERKSTQKNVVMRI